MKIHLIDAEEKIASVVSSMDADPRSWQGWLALHVESLDNLSEEEFKDAGLPAKAMIESYLKDIEGSAYFCNNKNIYVVCKNASAAILEQTGSQICELAFGALERSAKYHVYSLATNGRAFVERVFNDIGEKFSISSDLDALADIAPVQADTGKLAGPAKVLLVEDDAVTRWMVRNSIKDECEFATAQTASNVFSMYSSFQPDIVLLDIGLPDNSGDEVLEWIMRNDPGACVVMLSSKDDVDNISNCMKKGAKGFIPKPFVRENLLHYIRTYGCAA